MVTSKVTESYFQPLTERDSLLQHQHNNNNNNTSTTNYGHQPKWAYYSFTESYSGEDDDDFHSFEDPVPTFQNKGNLNSSIANSRSNLLCSNSENDSLILRNPSILGGSVSSSQLLSLSGKISFDQGIPFIGTIFYMLMILQGSFTLAMPFVIRVAGLAFIPIAMVLVIITNITSHLLIDCLYENSPRYSGSKRVHTSYVDIGRACFGKYGGWLVYTVNALYVVFNNAVIMVMFGDCLNQMIGEYISLSRDQLVLAFSFVFVPPLLIHHLPIMSVFSSIGVVCIIISSITCLITFICKVDQWSLNFPTIRYDRGGFPLGFALLMFSTMMHSVLPSIEKCMKNPGKVKQALNITYVISTIWKLLFGALGALSFGQSTNQLVALNVSQVRIEFKYIVQILLCIYSIVDVSVMYFVILEHLDTTVCNKVSEKFARTGAYHIPWLLTSRFLAVALCVSIALILPFFALLAGSVGAISGTCLSFIFPVVFHLKLKWRLLDLPTKMLEFIVLIVGSLIGCSAIYASLHALMDTAKYN